MSKARKSVEQYLREPDTGRKPVLSEVIQGALRRLLIARKLQEFRSIQGYWSRKARNKGILTERGLERLLRACKG